MNRFAFSAIGLPLVIATALNGQSPTSARVMPWISLDLSDKEGLEIHCRWIIQDQSVWMEFSNRGKKPIHFNYYLLGVQGKEVALTNPRIHLGPDEMTGGPISVKIPLAAHLALSSIPKLVDVRVGDPDEGSFRSESN